MFDFLPFTEETREKFDIDNHHAILQVNPDYSNKKELRGRDIWMNFPDSSTISKAEFMNVIHWGMVYITKRTVELSILFSSKNACRKFLDLSNEAHTKIYTALTNLPPNFRIVDGFSFWDKTPRPPNDKEWNDPIPCHELSWEEYEEICENP